MPIGAIKMLPHTHDVTAPDGSEVRILLSLNAGSMAHFQLAPGHVSRAVRHRSVEEIWYVLSGSGEMWQSAGSQKAILPLSAGTCLTIPVASGFQFRCTSNEPLTAVAVTMPPWPGNDEAEAIAGKWPPTL